MVKSPRSLGVCVTWIVVAIPLLLLGRQFLSHAVLDMSPPPGTDSAEAKQKMTDLFQNKINQKPVFIFIEAVPPTSTVITDSVKNFSLSAYHTLTLKGGDYSKDVVSVLGYYIFPEGTLINSGFINLEGTSTFISINYVGDDGNGFLDHVQNDIVNKYPLGSGYHVRLTGTDALVKDASKGTSSDLEHMDSISIPLALCVLGLSLWSVSLILLPVMTIPAAILVAFSIMFLITKVMAVPSFVASIMMSITIALSIDYALFLLSRFMEESRQSSDNDRCVTLALHRSGETILVSGLTIAIAFIGMTFFPVETLRVLGLGSFVSVIATMIANLTIIPAVLFLFGNFFRRACPCLDRWEPQIREAASPLLRHFQTPLDERSIVQSIDLERKIRDQQERSRWFRLARMTQNHPWVVIGVVVACGIPFITQLAHLKVEFNLFHMLPRNSEALKTFDDMTAVFGKGRTSPYTIVVETQDTIMSDKFFNLTQNLIGNLSVTPNKPQTRKSFSGIMLVNDRWVTYTDAAGYMSDLSGSVIARTYQFIFNGSTSENRKATYISIATDFDPLGGEAADWIGDIRDALKAFGARPESKGVHFYFGGGATTSYDSVHLVYSKLGIMIAVTFGVIIVVITAAFRSLLLPALLSFAMLFILGVTFGMGRLVFGTTWLHSISALKDVNALVWIVPVMSFSIICGLTLDYGIFLLTRVVEYRKAGFTTRASVIKATYKVGSVISAAGVIMFIAFSGLMFSQEMVLNQFGFMLCFSVLLDTIVIVPLLLPALIAVSSNLICVAPTRRPRVLWYPASLPPEEKTEDDVSEDVSIFAAHAAVNYGGIGVQKSITTYPPMPSQI